MTPTDRVIVVGLGPVGATVALLLGRLGVPTVALELTTTVLSSPRAVALDDEALRILQAAGLDKGTLPELLTSVPVQARSSRGRPLIELPARRTALGHPALAFFHQPDLEQVLRAALRDQPSVDVRLGHRVEGFESTGEEVVVTARDRCNGTRSRWRGRWIIACDGANSGVRRQAEIRLRGFTSRRRWLVVDAVLPAAADPSFAFICQPARPTVSAPLPGGRHRWEFMLLPGERPADMQLEDSVRQLVKRHAGVEDFEIIRASVYRFHARLAERWVQDRVLLAGDAAHLSPPFAGQGLSAGLRDAHNLAWKLAAVVNQQASPSLLESYETERRPHALRMIVLALTLGQLIQVRRGRTAAARDLSLQLALAAPRVRAHVTAGGWKPSARYARGLVARETTNRVTGTQFPQPCVVLSDGTHRRLDDLLEADFALIAWKRDPRLVLDRRSRTRLDELRARLVHAAPTHPPSGRSDADVLAVGDDADATLARWFARAQASLALIRPDRYVFAAFNPPQAPSAVGELARALHTDRRKRV